MFLEENAVIFECWKGALNHEQLCRLSVHERYKYIEQLNFFIEEKRKKNRISDAEDW